jgi:hypothetical protein
MRYKAIKLNGTHYVNSDGKGGKNDSGVVVGIFQEEESPTFKVLCTIDKNIGDEKVQFTEAVRMATLLNENNKYYTKEEVGFSSGDNCNF